MTKTRYVLAHLPEFGNEWKFLCVDDGEEIRIVYDYSLKRKKEDKFIGTTVINTLYRIRDATQDDLDEAFINEL